MGWSCEHCGDLGTDQPFQGDDEKLYCPKLDCPEDAGGLVVWVEEVPEDEKAKSGRSWTGDSHGVLFRDDDGKKKKTRTADEKRADDREVYRARKILADMDKRTTARKRGRVVKKRRTRVSEKNEAKSEAARKAAKDRIGTCSTCGQEKYILRKEPPTCTACYKASPDYKPKPKKPRKKPRKKKPAEAEAPDKIGLEVRAIEACARALEGLDPDQIERVLRWVAHKHRPDLFVPIGMTQHPYPHARPPQGLPGPSPVNPHTRFETQASEVSG